jgi:hypothetical protein
MVADDDTDATSDCVKGLLQWSWKGGSGVAGDGPIGRALPRERRSSAAEHGVPGAERVAGPHGRALVNKLDAEQSVWSEVVALNGVTC